MFPGPLGRPGTGLEPTKPLFGKAGFGVEPGILPLPTGIGAGGTPLVVVPSLDCGKLLVGGSLVGCTV